MKIDIVTPFFYPVLGGAEHYSLGIASGMAKKGHEIKVHTSIYNPVTGEKYPPQEVIQGNIAIRRYEPLFRLYHYYWWWKPKIGETDIVHLIGYGHLFSD